MSMADRVTTLFDLSRSQEITLDLYERQLRRSARTFAENRLAVLGLLIVVVSVVLAVFAPVLAPYDPMVTQRSASGGSLVLSEPSLAHPFGTTHLGRDVFSQWIWGSRVSLLVGTLSGLSVMVIGTSVGMIAGYFRGTVDLVVMRVVDILYGIPAVPLILIVAMFTGASVWVVILSMMAVLWRSMARVTRSQTLSLSNQPFVKTARAAGASHTRIMAVHILPNLIPLILVEGTFVVGSAIILEAGISFLGLGAADMVSWGSMLELTFSSGAIWAWWWIVPPGVSITLLVLSFFYISRGIEAVTNPEIET